MSEVLIKNAKAIVTCNQTDDLYWDTDILIKDGLIIDIGKNIIQDGVEVIDGKGKFVYPGLINTHHHFFQTFVRNLLKVDYVNLSVVDWLKEVYSIFKIVDEDVIYYSSLTAMADLIKHGCTTAFDHQYCYTKNSGKFLVDRQMEAAGKLGIRYHAGRGSNTLPESEGSTICNEMLESTDEFLYDCDRLINKYHDASPLSMQQIVIAPCQPINSYKETFIESANLARSKNVYLHTHLGEGENEIMVEKYGKRTLEWCQEIDFVGKDVWYAHGWELTNDEIKTLGKVKSGVAHCPGPAVLGGYPILDMKKFESEGALVSLGCDGSATNDGSSLLDTLRMGYLMQAYNSKSRGGSVTPYEMLKMATVNGAKTLGRDMLGSLEIGKAADLFMIDTDKLELLGALHDPKNIISRVGVTGNVWLTMVNGKTVYKDGMLTGINENEIVIAGQKVFNNSIRDKSIIFK